MSPRTRPGGPATRDYHPSKRRSTTGKTPAKRAAGDLAIPRDADDVVVQASGREVRLTNVNKPFWPELGITKGDLLQYYADVSPALLPHLAGRAMVMKRYPHGAAGEFFFMKRAPQPRPEWTSSADEHGPERDRFPIGKDPRAVCASSTWLHHLTHGTRVATTSTARLHSFDLERFRGRLREIIAGLP